MSDERPELFPVDKLPKNPQHQRLADLVLSGLKKADAYQVLHPRSKKASATGQATRILKRLDVVTYMQEVRARAASETVLTVKEKRQFLARVVRSQVDSLPDDSDLFQEVRHHETENSTSTHRKIPSKTECIKLDNELSGDDPATTAIQDIAKVFSKLGG